MKRSKLIVILFTVAMCAVAIALLAGCSPTRVVPKTDYMVTFDYNVDNLGVATNCKTQYLAVYAGSKIIAPSGSDPFKKSTIDNFYNEGWYTAVLNEDGDPVKDEDGNIELKDKWNFDTDVVNQDITLYANFKPNPTLTVIVEGGDNLVVSQEPGTLYNRPSASINKPQREGYTFIDYYADETFNTKFTFPYTFTTENEVCYAKMLEGEWTIVTSTNDFIDALIGKTNMYFNVEGGQLDFGTRWLDSVMSIEYKGKIYGNGCVIKNMELELSYSRAIGNYSLFGNLSSNAEIKDLSFENISLEMTVTTTATDEIKVSLFATDIAEGAKLENVSFKNCSLTYKGRSYYDIDQYGYYVSGGESYDCFDEEQLTVNYTITKVDRTQQS